MNKPDLQRSAPAQRPEEVVGLRQFADRAFTRAVGAALVPGNRIRILRDATENFPAWLEAIRSAERTVYFESYIIGDDPVGREFVQALAGARASGGPSATPA